MATEPDLVVSAGFSDAQLVKEANRVVEFYRKKGQEAQKAFQDAQGKVTNTQAARAHARDLDKLSRAYDPVYRAAKRYEDELKRLDRALDVGAINQKQYADQVGRAAREMNIASGAVAGATKNFSGGGNTLQQVGFQIGDFATQVGAGTSAAQALGQQLPQLLGSLGAWGAVAGAAAAIAVPLGAALLKMAFDAETLDEKIERLNDTTEDYAAKAEAAATPIEILRQRYGALADEVARANSTMALLASAQAKTDLFGASRSISKVSGADARVDRSFGLSEAEWADVQASAMEKLRAKTGATVEQAERLRMALNRTDSSNSLEATAKDAENLLSIIAELSVTATDDQRGFLSGWAAQVSAVMTAAQDQIRATRSEFERVTDQYETDTEKLRSLSNDRKIAEDMVAKAIKDGGAAAAIVAKERLALIDAEILKTKELISANDEVMQSRIRSYQVYGASRMQSGAITGGAIDVIKDFEGFRSKPYWDVNAYRAGFGSDTVTLADGSVQKVVQGMTVSLADANRDLVRRVGEFQQDIIGDIGAARFDSFTTEQQAALTSIAYNYGSLPDRIIEAVRSGTAADIGNAIASLAGDNGGVNADRRRREASSFGGGSAGFADFEAQQQAQKDADKAASDALKEQVREREKQLNLAKQLSDQLSSNLLTEQQSLELDRQRAEQVAAINASDLTDQEKAAAIAAVNAALEKQATILKITEDAKRRGVDLDAKMIGSAMTYRQAIEALGEAEKQKSISQQRVNAELERTAEAQAYAARQQEQFEQGFVDAILSAENFGDALKNLVVQMLLAAAQAQLMAGLFGKGPMATGGGGLLGDLSGLIGGFSSGGYTGAGGRYDPAGIVHKGEYVMSAPAVQRIGLPTLEALHNGRSVAGGGGSMSYSPSITIAGDASERTVALIESALDRERAQFFGRWSAAQKQYGSRVA